MIARASASKTKAKRIARRTRSTLPASCGSSRGDTNSRSLIALLLILPGADRGFFQLVDVLINRRQRLRVRRAVKFSIGNAHYFAQTGFIEGDRRILIINTTASVRQHTARSLVHYWEGRDPI